MSEYLYTYIGKDCISINIDLTYPEIASVGERIKEISDYYYEEDDLNISTWQAFLNNYFRFNAPEIYEKLKVIPASDYSKMYCAYIEGVNEETKALAKKFVSIFNDLIENEEKAYSFLEQNANDIDWDRCTTVKKARLDAIAPYGICDYVLYGLYLGDPGKFSVSMSGDYPTGPRRTGDDSGYCIELNHNNHGIEHHIVFQITSTGPDTVYVQGGLTGTDYVEADMDADSAIKLLLTF